MTPTEIQRQCDEIVKLGEKAKLHNPHRGNFDDVVAFADASRTFAPAAPVALKVAIKALEKCVRDIEFWSNILDKEWSGFDGQLYAASNQARQALAAITNAFHE